MLSAEITLRGRSIQDWLEENASARHSQVLTHLGKHALLTDARVGGLGAAEITVKLLDVPSEVDTAARLFAWIAEVVLPDLPLGEFTETDVLFSLAAR